MTRLPKLSWCLLVPILLIVVWLGAVKLNSDSLWLDEYWSMYHAGGIDPLSLPQVWSRVAQEDPWQAPGYYMLLNIWGSLVGWSEFATRALALLFGVLAVAWVARLGRDLLSPFGGLTAGLVMGLSAYFIYFTHELRAYSLSVLLTVIALWAYHRLIQPRPRPLYYVLLFVSAVGLFYTHYFAALSLVALGMYHILFATKNRNWWIITGILAVAGLLFLPWVSVLLNALGAAGDQRDVRGSFALSARQSVEGVLYMFSNGSVALIVIVLAFGLRRDRSAIFAWFWTLCLIGLLLLINERFRVILEVRYLLALWPGLALLTALGLRRLAQYSTRIAVAVLAVWGLAGIWGSLDAAAAPALHNPQWHLPWHTLARDLKPRVVQGDSVVFLLSDWTWAVYHGDLIHYYLGALDVRYQMIERPQNIGDEAYDKQARQATTNTRRLWLAYSQQQPREHLPRFEARLAEQQFARCDTVRNTDELRLDLYGSVAADDRPGTLEFSTTGGTITYVPVTPLPAQVNTALTTLDGWRVDAGVNPNTYSVALHLVDEQGNLAAQADYGLPNEALACHPNILDTTTLTPGEYTLMMTVYAWESGQRLLAENAGADGRVVMGTMHIQH